MTKSEIQSGKVEKNLMTIGGNVLYSWVSLQALIEDGDRRSDSRAHSKKTFLHSHRWDLLCLFLRKFLTNVLRAKCGSGEMEKNVMKTVRRRERRIPQLCLPCRFHYRCHLALKNGKFIHSQAKANERELSKDEKNERKSSYLLFLNLALPSLVNLYELKRWRKEFYF